MTEPETEKEKRLTGYDHRRQWTLKKTEPIREAFLAALEKNLSVSAAAEAAGVPLSTVYYWRKKWKWFETQWENAQLTAINKLVEDAYQMALGEGTKNRDLPDHVRANMLQFMLKGNKPAVYDRRALQSAAMAAELESEDGTKGRIIIARVAPGVIDGLLEGSPLANPENQILLDDEGNEIEGEEPDDEPKGEVSEQGTED